MPENQPPSAQPQNKRVIAFFDGQNLFYAAREAFHYHEPNYDPVALARRLSAGQGWQLSQVRFYTGVPGHQEDPRWYSYWTAKLQGLRNAGVMVFQSPLRYRHKEVELPLKMSAARRAHFLLPPDGTSLPPGTKLYLPDGRELPDGTGLSVRVGEEKGIDIRLALDLIRLTREQSFDVGLIFSQDQDQAEAVKEANAVAKQQGRTLEMYSAFPEGSRNQVGIQHTRTIKIDGATYAAVSTVVIITQPSDGGGGNSIRPGPKRHRNRGSWRGENSVGAMNH